MNKKNSLCVFLIALLAPCFAQGAVDDARLQGADRDNSSWLMYGRDYSNQRYSPLKQINRDNVARLAPRWSYQTGIKATFQATPLVVDGVMYLSTPFNHVVALDARNGKQLWRYEHRRNTQKMCCGPANRGVAVGYGKVFIGTVDTRLIALDQKTGKVVWDISLVDAAGNPTEAVEQLNADDPLRKAQVTGSTGAGIAMAPMVYQGKVIVGITGVGYGLHLDSPRANAPLGAVVGVAGHYGRPGFLAAFDVETGKRIWQFDTTAASGWEGEFRQTTPDGAPLQRDIAQEKTAFPQFADAWKYGGGSAWSTPAIDARRGLLFFGVGNPSPQMDDVTRPGDNLYTVSLVALDAATGKLRWYYQQVPHDLWGYDVASPPVLFDLTVNGRKTPVVGQAGKTGWFYVNDRSTGKFLFKSEAFVPQSNLFARPTAEGVRIEPGAVGGANWSPAAYDAGTGLAYVAAMHMPMRYTVHEVPAEKDKPALRYSAFEPTDEPNWGTLSALDLRHGGKIKWQHKTPQPLIGGVLATAGGLVFTGEGNGMFDAFDATTGKLLWQYQADAGVNAPPITYRIDGVQYIAVAAGGSQLFGYKQGDSVLVFALPK
ncbi:MAG: pyrroloquinoline quinone-dependent dehydrogenase [Burkholderiales bacterium]